MSDARWQYGLVGGLRLKNLVYIGPSKGIIYVCLLKNNSFQFLKFCILLICFIIDLPWERILLMCFMIELPWELVFCNGKFNWSELCALTQAEVRRTTLSGLDTLSILKAKTVDSKVFVLYLYLAVIQF